jgi:hypothetical protein
MPRSMVGLLAAVSVAMSAVAGLIQGQVGWGPTAAAVRWRLQLNELAAETGKIVF